MTARCDRRVLVDDGFPYGCCALAPGHRGDCELLSDERAARELAEDIPPNPGARLEASGHRSCNLCDAVDDGNLTCWACIARWPTSESRTYFLSIMKDRAPERPCGADDVARFVAKLSKSEI